MLVATRLVRAVVPPGASQSQSDAFAVTVGVRVGSVLPPTTCRVNTFGWIRPWRKALAPAGRAYSVRSLGELRTEFSSSEACCGDAVAANRMPAKAAAKDNPRRVVLSC